MALTTAPTVGTYRFVLRKIAEHDPSIEEIVSGYDESVYTRDITHPDGLRRRTAFVTSEPTRDRYCKLGWEDVTALWTQPQTAPAGQQPAASDPPARPRVVRVRG